MLRGLVVLFLLVNAGLYWWLHDNSTALQSDREPQRLNHQVMPEAVQVLPDLPAASAPRHAGSSASTGSVAASARNASASVVMSVSTIIVMGSAMPRSLPTPRERRDVLFIGGSSS